MKYVSALLALALGVTAAFAQEAAPGSKKDQAVTSINDRGAVAAPLPTGAGPTIESLPAAGSGTSSGRSPSLSGTHDANGPVSLFELAKSGGWGMFVMAGMSFVMFMLVLVNLFTLRRSAILTPHYMNTADVLLKKKDYLGLLAISSRHSEAVARVVQRTLDFSTKNPGASFDVIKEIAESEGSAQAAALQHRPSYLADIGMLSPMVGLLFTVWGIIRSFGVLGSGSGELAKSRDVLLASGVSEALVATGTGLIIGIIAFMFYAFFRNKVQSLISDLEIASSHVVGLIAINYSKRREASRAVIEDEF